jgi:hypothetical protein
LHRTLENWIDEDDDDHEIDTRHLLPGWLKEVLTEVKASPPKSKPTFRVMRMATSLSWKPPRNEARHKAKAKYEEMVEAKVEAWKAANPGEHYPGEPLYRLRR